MIGFRTRAWECIIAVGAMALFALFPATGMAKPAKLLQDGLNCSTQHALTKQSGDIWVRNSTKIKLLVQKARKFPFGNLVSVMPANPDVVPCKLIQFEMSNGQISSVTRLNFPWDGSQHLFDPVKVDAAGHPSSAAVPRHTYRATARWRKGSAPYNALLRKMRTR